MCWGGAANAKTLNREMDSHVYTRFIPLVGGVLNGWTGSSVVGAPGLRGCGGKMPMRYDKTFETLADMSARFVQFREVLLAMEGKANANGRAAEISLCARLAPRVYEYCRRQDTTTLSRGLRSVTACSCPRKRLPQNRARGRRRLRLVKPAGKGSHGSAAAAFFKDGGRPACRASCSSS